MTTDKQLIDKWAVIKLLRGKWIAKYPVSFYFGLIAAADEIEKLPAEVAVKVVRCKDCVYRHTRPSCQGRSLEWYCPNGERKTNEP